MAEGTEMNLVLVILGGWIVFDGIFSILIYSGQTLPEHLVRIVRALIGLTIVAYALYAKSGLKHRKPFLTQSDR